MDTCDVCYVAKALWVAILNKVDTVDAKLYFCNHHFQQNRIQLEKQGFICIKTES